MSEERHINDVDLTSRIRRSMQHYRMDLPASELAPRPARDDRTHLLALAGAAAAAVVVTVAALSVASGLLPNLGREPGASGPVGPTPPAAAPSSEAIAAACLAQVRAVPEDERLPDESEEAALARLRALPLLIARPESGNYLLADGVAWVLCSADGGTPTGYTSGLLDDDGRILAVRAWQGPAPSGVSVAMGTYRDPAFAVQLVLDDGSVREPELAGEYWLDSWSGPAASLVVALNRVAAPVAQVEIPGTRPGDPPADPTPVPDEIATTLCLDIGPEDVQDDWLEPGEDAGQVAARMGSLPLAVSDHRDVGSAFLYGDGRFFVACEFVPGADRPGFTRGVAAPAEGRQVGVLAVRSRPVVVDDAGQPVDGSEPDTFVIGAADRGIDRVTILLEDGSELPATLGGGMWLAWWQERLGGVAVRAYADGALVEEVAADLRIHTLPEGGLPTEG